MDIVAPVFAYLACVAGIVGAFVLSFSLVFSTPNAPASAERSAAIVSATPAKAAALVDAKKPVLKGEIADNSAVNHVVAAAPTTQKREAAPQTAAAPQAAPQKPTAFDARQKTKISRAQWRQIVQQERNRRVAYQQNSDFESRFLGYAD